jgi:hypothetical protein
MLFRVGFICDRSDCFSISWFPRLPRFLLRLPLTFLFPLAPPSSSFVPLLLVKRCPPFAFTKKCCERRQNSRTTISGKMSFAQNGLPHLLRPNSFFVSFLIFFKSHLFFGLTLRWQTYAVFCMRNSTSYANPTKQLQSGRRVTRKRHLFHTNRRSGRDRVSNPGRLSGTQPS